MGDGLEMTPKQYWWTIKTLRQAYKVKKTSNFPATAITAVAILESYYGKSIPIDIKTGKISNNLFGIKSLIKNGEIIIEGDNGSIFCYTHEWNKSRGRYLTTAYFRAYKSYESCFLDYINIIKNSKDDNGEQRYREAFNYLDDAEQFIIEIYQAGYATDPKYLEAIIPIIRQLNRIPVWVLKL